MRQHTIPLADVIFGGDDHSNMGTGMIPSEERSAAALSAFLQRHGAKATPTDDGTGIVVRTRTRRDADRLEFALVCYLAGTSYRNEAAWWARNVASTKRERR